MYTTFINIVFYFTVWTSLLQYDKMLLVQLYYVLSPLTECYETNVKLQLLSGTKTVAHF